MERVNFSDLGCFFLLIGSLGHPYPADPALPASSWARFVHIGEGVRGMGLPGLFGVVMHFGLGAANVERSEGEHV